MSERTRTPEADRLSDLPKDLRTSRLLVRRMFDACELSRTARVGPLEFSKAIFRCVLAACFFLGQTGSLGIRSLLAAQLQKSAQNRHRDCEDHQIQERHGFFPTTRLWLPFYQVDLLDCPKAVFCL